MAGSVHSTASCGHPRRDDAHTADPGADSMGLPRRRAQRVVDGAWRWPPRAFLGRCGVARGEWVSAAADLAQIADGRAHRLGLDGVQRHAASGGEGLGARRALAPAGHGRSPSGPFSGSPVASAASAASCRSLGPVARPERQIRPWCLPRRGGARWGGQLGCKAHIVCLLLGAALTFGASDSSYGCPVQRIAMRSNLGHLRPKSRQKSPKVARRLLRADDSTSYSGAAMGQTNGGSVWR